MNIIVNIDEVTLASIVDQSYRQIGEDDWTAEGVTLGEIVATKIVERLVADHDRWDTIRRRVTEVRDETIREAVAPKVAEAISAPVRMTNTYGEPTGAETTLTELIVKEARETLTRRSDYGRGPSNLEKEIQKAVTAAFHNEVAAEVKKVRDAVASQLAGSVGAEIQKAITAGLKAAR